MFIVNDDQSIYATRGDIVFFTVTAEDNGVPYHFQPGDILRMAIYGKKDAESCVMQKDFAVEETCERYMISLDEEDTKIGKIISKPKDYWYEVVLNPDTMPQTIIGYDEDGPKVFRLMPESEEIEDDYKPKEEDFPVVDDQLDLLSPRPVSNRAVSREIAAILTVCEKTHDAVTDSLLTPVMFGAIGDGKADDTVPIMEAAEFCREHKCPLTVQDGTYRITETIDLRYMDVDIKGTVLVAHHGVGLLVGDRSDSADRRIVRISRVSHESYADGDISVRIVGLMNGDVNIANAKYVQLYADGDSEYSAISYSNFHVGKCDYLQITDKPGTANIGWINENTFYNCRVMVKFSIEGNTYAHNNNVFYKPCFENAAVVLSQCTRNKFYDIRTEGKFSAVLAENTSLNLLDYNFYYTFPFIANNVLGITDNGTNNTITNSSMRDMESVLVYNLNAQTFRKNLYEIGCRAKMSASDDKLTIASAWAGIVTDAIIPVKGIRFLRANSDAGAFRFTFTPLDENKEVMTNSPLVQDGNGAGQNSNGAYNIQADSWGATIAITDPDVAYIKLSISTGSSKNSFTFTNLSLWAYYHTYDFRRAAILSDFFRTAIS